MVATVGTEEGYLVLADISGYTAFLTGTELEHAQGILRELIELIVGKLAPPMRLEKLEGDAVFTCLPVGPAPLAERVLELVEACYCEFAGYRDDMQRATTCTCAACRSISTLDLKFIVHRGTYVRHRVAGADEVAGPDVILVHRLLKNSAAATVGSRAYALLTAEASRDLPAAVVLTGHHEQVADMGDVRAVVQDLAAVLRERRANTRVYTPAADADAVFHLTIPAPPPVAWHCWFDETLRKRWMTDLRSVKTTRNGSGRVGVGAEMHCVHGPGSGQTFHRYVDMQPFHYFSESQTPAGFAPLGTPPMDATVEFQPTGKGSTRLEYRVRLKNRGRMARIPIKLMAAMVRRSFAAMEKRLADIARDELAAMDTSPASR